MNDTEEALLLFQIETFSFHIPPSRFAEVLLSGVPAGPFAQSVQNMAGHPVDRDALAETLRATIAIWPGFRRRSLRSPRSCRILERNCFSSTPPLTQVMVRAWLTHGVIDLLSGYTAHEVEHLPARSNDRGLGSALEEFTFTSSEAQPGKSGVVQIKHRRGLRITEEIAVLIHTLRGNDFEVFVVSASLEEVVAVFRHIVKVWLRSAT